MKIKLKIILIQIVTMFIVGFYNTSAKEELNQTALNAQEHVKYLASDELEGRYPGTPGIEKAKDYILNQFKNMNLKPINGKNTQSVDVTVGYELGEGNQVYFNVIIPKPGVPIEMSRPIKKPWDLPKDWMPVSLSENGEIEAPMVFVGYGISAKDLKYDDYSGIDIKNKIAVVLSNSPDGEKQETEFAQYTSYRYKASNAREHGAIGVIFVKIQGDSANVFEPLDCDRFERNTGVIAIQVNRNRIAEYFPKNCLYPTELEINKTRQPKSFELPNAKIHIKVALKDKIVKTDNVFGIIEGTDPKLKDEYIVVGAHYDHLGWGGPTSAYRGKKPMIHNGADDNASGVSAVIEAARAISQNPLRRSVIFVAFTAEELGILGSTAFANNPPVDIGKIVMMINLDMVGRLKDNNIHIIGTGSSPIFDSIINELDAADTLTVIKSESPLGASDQTAFYLKNIPSIFFFTGVHLDYHKPTDDWDKLNYPGISKVVDFLVKTLNKFGNLDERPPFHKVIESTPPQEGSSNKSGSKVWFGIIPNFDPETRGMKISGASPGSPADKAGLKENDIITKINDKEVKNLHDFTFIIREHNPGDELNVKFLRDNEEKQVIVKLVSKE